METVTYGQNTSQIVDGLKEYWSQRSESYSSSNLSELNSDKRDVWMKILLDNAPKGECLKVLDVGAGPGFFSMLMASAGHQVTAVDVTADMLNQAKQNAEDLGLKVEFAQIGGYELPFEDNSFDLIINRNVVWNIEKPQLAFREWQRVLRPGGRTVYFDANWYLYLYDQEVRNTKEKAKEECLKKFGDLHYSAHKNATVNLENIARNLELSKEVRPMWDEKALDKAGMDVIKIDTDIYERVWDEKEKLEHAANPMFMVVAEKAVS